MSQQCAPIQIRSATLQALLAENDELKKHLIAQKAVISSLERRAGRSLESMGVHLNQLITPGPDSTHWQRTLDSMQHEVDCLCDLLADTMLLQKLEAGKVEVRMELLPLHPLLASVTRHLLEPKLGERVRIVQKIDPYLPVAWADQDLLEAVLTDLLARSLRYSDSNSPVVLEADYLASRIYLRITAQRFAPAGDRDFATEIVLCCRRIEVQNGEITCQHHPDGLQTVTIALQTAS